MRIVTVDCGTTNSRVYVVDENGMVLGKAVKKVGVKDTSITGSNVKLKEGLKEVFYEALANARIDKNKIDFIISSGMITSEIGLVELPHLWAPVGMVKLAENIVKIEDLSVFPKGIPVYFIRGVKNKYDPGSIKQKDVGILDFMRGEEAQVAGIIDIGIMSPPFTVVMLSSHTKYISINEKGEIAGSITTISGQMYEALLSSSFIGKSIQGNGIGNQDNMFDEATIENALFWVEKAGLLRSLVMTRFLDVLLNIETYKRKLFVEACIAAEDIKAFNQFDLMGFEKNTPYLIIGKEKRCRLYSYLIGKQIDSSKNITILSNEGEIDSLSINGALYLAREANIY